MNWSAEIWQTALKRATKASSTPSSAISSELLAQVGEARQGRFAGKIRADAARRSAPPAAGRSRRHGAQACEQRAMTGCTPSKLPMVSTVALGVARPLERPHGNQSA